MEVKYQGLVIRGHTGSEMNDLWYELEAPPTTDADIQVEMGLKGAHAITVNASKSHSKVKTTKQDHFRRIFRICHWLLKEYPDRDQVETRLTDEVVKHTKSGRRFLVNRINLNYENMEPGLIIAFLSMNKTRQQVHRDTGIERTVHQSQVHMRKYLDALSAVAQVYGREVNPVHLKELHTHKMSMRKEQVKAASEGKTVKCDADPIPFPMYNAFANHLMELGDYKNLAWVTMEWNMMGRSQHVENLAYHAMEVNNDALRMHHDGGKADKNGDRNTYKHMYANPWNAATCPVLTMGLHFALDHAVDASAFVFPQRDSDAQCFRRAFNDWIEGIDPTVLALWVRLEHALPHGFRKGSTTHCGTQTMCPPPMASICRRAEWTMGDMLDIYMNFGDVGDRYLGRILSGLNPNSISFATLPPHFTCDANDERIATGLRLTFPHLVDHHGDLRGVLIFMLASLVYHSPTIMGLAKQDLTHPFNNLRLFHDVSFLQSLRAIVTIETTEAANGGPKLIATGIPPHVLNMIDMEKLSSVCVRTLTFMQSQQADIRQCIGAALNARDAENGQLSAHALDERLNKWQASIERMLQAATTIHERANEGNEREGVEPTGVEPIGVQEGDGAVQSGSIHRMVYPHSGGFWAIPKTFAIPKKLKRRDAWYLWFHGKPGFMEGGKHCPIRPFRDVQPKMVRDRKVQKGIADMRVVFEMMEEELPPIPRPTNVTVEWCDTNYVIAERVMEEKRVSFMYNESQASEGTTTTEEAEETTTTTTTTTTTRRTRKRKKLHPERYQLKTWAQYLRPSHVSSHGQERDVQNMRKRARKRGTYKKAAPEPEDDCEEEREEEREEELEEELDGQPEVGLEEEEEEEEEEPDSSGSTSEDVDNIGT